MSEPQGSTSIQKIDDMSEHSGRHLKENNQVVNVVDGFDIYSKSSPVHLKDAFNRSVMATTFGQLAVSMKDSQINEQFPYGLPSTGVVSAVTGSGSIATENSMLHFKTTTANGTAFAESLQALRYIPGSMAYAFFTLSGLPVGKANCKALGGIFDDEDGFMLGCVNGGMVVARRRYDTVTLTATTEYIQQQNWNLDKLDGTGPSGLTIDFTKGQVFSITYGYLGFAPITFALLGADDGWIPFHKIQYPNTSFNTHISQPYLPIRIEVANTGSNQVIDVGIGSLDVGIFNGGKTDSAARPIGVIGSKLLATPKTFTGTSYVIALRGSQLLGTRKNKISVLINTLSWNTDASVKAVGVYAIKNPTVTTLGTWTPISTDSPIEYSINAVFNLATGFPTGIASSLAKEQSRDLELYVENTLIRRGEIVVFVCQSTNGTIGEFILGLKELL